MSLLAKHHPAVLKIQSIRSSKQKYIEQVHSGLLRRAIARLITTWVSGRSRWRERVSSYQTVTAGAYTSKRPPSRLDRAAALSADPWYTETISPINRARRVARQTGSRGLGFAHERHDDGEPVRTAGRPATSLENVGERRVHRVKVLRPVLRKTRANIASATRPVARARLHGKSRNRLIGATCQRG